MVTIGLYILLKYKFKYLYCVSQSPLGRIRVHRDDVLDKVQLKECCVLSHHPKTGYVKDVLLMFVKSKFVRTTNKNIKDNKLGKRILSIFKTLYQFLI